MKDDLEQRDLIIVDDEPPSGAMRMLPMVVVGSVVAGFMALAWYAYHSGSQSAKEDDLPVIEADKTPIREKPLDPGGMQFPNQDKTIFETFDGKSQAPAKVERVLPTPEEPISRDAPETSGWINDNVKKADNAPDVAQAPEQVIGAAETPNPLPPVEAKPATAADESQTQTYVAPPETSKPIEVPSVPVAIQATPVQSVAPAIVQTAKKGAASAQLGAYRSQAEAKAAWDKLAKKHTQLLSDKEPNIVKADLGAKGIYYRLRVSSFPGATEAAAFCRKLTASGQACIVPAGK